MNVLVIGSGGREHALVWKLRQSRKVDSLYCAPGNPGIASLAELVPIPANDVGGLLEFATTNSIDLTVVGPEQPLLEGIVDRFNERGLRIFGPSRSAAMLEGSKSFAKQFMQRHRIPTAEYRTFEAAEIFEAERYISEIPVPIVIKADGLAAGKGVLICETKDTALECLDAIIHKRVFGDAGRRIVIEEYLVGEEASVLALTDGVQFMTLPPAQDHKRIFDDDKGKNTGGMGAYAPAALVYDETLTLIEKTIIKPVIDGMREEGIIYKGCLYAGLMLTQTGPKVVEFNCRFGDPETQVLLPILNEDLADLLHRVADGTLDSRRAETHDMSAVCVVIASRGYPDQYETGKPILGLDGVENQRDVVVFHAGTTSDKKSIVTAGGRVLGVTAFGPRDNLEATISAAYRTVQKITFDGAYYRSDIGRKGLLASWTRGKESTH